MEIRIGKSTRACARTKKPFVHGQELYSLVRAGEDGLERQDYAKDAWEPACGEGAIAVWATSYVDPNNLQKESEAAFSPLRRLFYDAVESDNRLDLARAYLAAQLLRRQKVFRLIKEGEESDTDTKFMLFTDRLDDRMIEVRDPNLTYAELNAARTALMECINQQDAPDPSDETEATVEASAEEETVAAASNDE